jgi:hypothetical protein
MVILVCDMCADEGREDVRAETVMVGGYEVEGCDLHRTQLAVMAEVLTKYGRPAKGKRPTMPGAQFTTRGRPPGGKDNRAGRRVVCQCGDEVAFASKSWHANARHDGAKSSELKWTEL